jgi:hypothetical protein
LKSRLIKKDLERLEPYEAKVSSTVLRGEWGSNVPDLPDYEDEYFAKRMYQYYSRIFDKYNKEIEAIAVFTYESNKHKYNKYESKFINTKLTYEYSIYDIAKQNLEELKNSKNPFSFVVEILLKVFNYKETDQNNFNFKIELTKLLLNSGFIKEEINNLFRFINFVFEIKNKKLSKKFYEEAHNMSLSTETEFEYTDYDLVVAEIEAKKIAKNMLKEGLSLEITSKVTGLSIEEIKEI